MIVAMRSVAVGILVLVVVVIVIVRVSVMVRVFLIMIVSVRMGVIIALIRVRVIMGVMMAFVIQFVVVIFRRFMSVRQMDIELHAFDVRFLPSGSMNMVTSKIELGQFILELVDLDAQIDQRAEKHVSADAAENIQVKGLHSFKPQASSKLAGGVLYPSPRLPPPKD